MKRFNFKNPRTQKWFLVSGLMLALGFNLSWNPENTHIARFEHLSQMIELASSDQVKSPQDAVDTARARAAQAQTQKAAATKDNAKDSAKASAVTVTETTDPNETTESTASAGPQFESFNLRDLQSSFCNAKVTFAVAKEDANDAKTVIYMVEGDICPTCEHTGAVTVTSKNLKDDMNKIQLAIAHDAADRLCVNGTDGKKVSSKDDEGDLRKRVTDDDTACDKDDDVETLLSCQSDEMTELANGCEEFTVDRDLKKTDKKLYDKNKALKSACESRVKSYYKKFLSKTLRKGLADPSSEGYADAVGVRDTLLNDLPEGFDDIRGMAVAASANAIYDHTRAVYTACLSQQSCANGKTDIATTYAQASMARDIQQTSYPLLETLYSYGSDNDKPQAMIDLFNLQFQNPLVTYWQKSVESKSLDLQPFALVDDTNGVLFNKTLPLGLNVSGSSSTEATNGLNSGREARAQSAGVPVIPKAMTDGSTTGALYDPNDSSGLMGESSAPPTAPLGDDSARNRRAP